MSQMRRFVEQRITKDREAQAKTQYIRNHLVEHNILAGHGRADLRVEAKRRAREQETERRELFNDYTFVKGEQDRERKGQIAEMESRFAAEIERRKAESIREEQNRKRICESSEELRALKEKLHAAQVNKHRAAQMMEWQARQNHEKMREQKIAEHMETERMEHQELERKLDLEKAKQRYRVKEIIQEQICQKEALRDEANQEYMKEKGQVESLVRRIQEEDEMEIAARRMKQTEQKEILAQWMAERQARQQEMIKNEQDENNRIEAYAAEKRNMEESLAAEKERQEIEKRKVLMKMIGDQEAKNKEAAELEKLRNDLYQEELEAEHRRREDLQMRKRLEDRKEMMTAYAYQMNVKKEKEELEKQEEAAFRDQLMQKFLQDERLEKMNADRRRRMIQQHKKEVERLLQERRKMYEAERNQEMEERNQAAAEEEQRQLVIEQERQRLLAVHAQPLKDFLPKGTLERESDLDIVMTARAQGKPDLSGDYQAPPLTTR
eukprot:gnl/MRDRNA2_/MRDRNA2_87556_c0_seq1.p1 gnl/MRDRNA2_/MRDRNA2_87556_c0~~gnl/MRDRNA2_/MRDRNA2_87556_c0_seq1.p1  ORF type:complete len:495 (-),score=185.18 gnl/MRDRNA2_/MRDRNA2_87556_c0_seq1:9-1493(-)